ncbi:MAG: AAA family ATPase [Desulfomonile tiedjei]|nr:AAA family ATPase [Desulfomonile tiedjei]
MISIPGYRTLDTIYESPSSIVLRARRHQDDFPVILKILKPDYPSPQEIIRYKQEYCTTRNLSDVSGVIRAYDLHKYQNTLVIVVEDFGAESLSILKRSTACVLSDALTIAIRIVEILGNIHAAHIIHKDINPSNIVLNPSTGELKIIDFGISTELSRENPGIRNPEVTEGTLAYLSPEQTGRMNRSLDYRSDYYSFGVSLYELLVGMLPFETTDPLELLHCHIAQLPTPPHLLNPTIPEVLANVVMKLLAKNAEDRYQSASGIRADLVECQERLRAYGVIEPFPIASRDVPQGFHVPQKLYGRRRETLTLLEAFDRVSRGRKEITLVTGRPGIGKTSLVREIYKPITGRRGYFVSGKFDQFQRGIPYSAIISAFQDLVRQILTQSEEQLSTWREELLSALGPNGQVIATVIPEVELVLGEQPPVDEVGPADALNRFNLVFQRFIRVFSRPEHPLVVFLDDVQWADSASLHLLSFLAKDRQTRHLFFIMAYRDTEVSQAHPLITCLEDLEEIGTPLNKISLGPLSLDHMVELTADTLHTDGVVATPLAELIRQKTGGNPFFINEFLKSLYVEGLLEFEAGSGRWEWNLDRIRARDITDNVVELMAGKILKLGSQALETLTLAACAGNRFDLETLSIMCEKTPEETLHALWGAVAEGLVLPLTDAWKSIELGVREACSAAAVEFKFAHDRVQQAAYSIIPVSELETVHLKAGRMLLSRTQADRRDQRLFDIVNHLNLGAKLLETGAQRQDLARLDLLAGRKAMASAAYGPAFHYLKAGLGLLGDDAWHTDYELALTLHVEAVEAAYLSTEFHETDRLTRIVLENARTLLDRVKVYEVAIRALAAQNKMVDAVDLARQVLRLLGVRLPEKPTKLHVISALVKTKWFLWLKRFEALDSLPAMTDPFHLATMRILSSASKAAYMAVPEMLPLLLLKLLRLSLQHGNAPESSIAYAAYGFLLIGFLGQLDEGYRFGRLGLRMAEQFNDGKLKSRTSMVFNLLIRHWKSDFRAVLKPMQEAYQSGLEHGNLEDAAVSAFIYCSASYHMGKELTRLEREIASYNEVIRKLAQQSSLHLNLVFRQAILNLMGRSEHLCELHGEAYDETTMLPVHLQAHDWSVVFIVYLNKLILCCLFQEFDKACQLAESAKAYVSGVIGTLSIPLLYLYEAVAKLGIYADLPRSAQRQVLARVAATQKHMKKWAHSAPMNFHHPYLMVEAERHRVLGNHLQAMDCYERAIQVAREHEYLREEALANELAGKYYLELGRASVARSYIQEARYCYLRWGAIAKVADVDRRYYQLLRDAPSVAVPRARDARTTLTVTGTTLEDVFDLTSVIKAARAISGEIILGRLLEQLIRIVMENAGAQSGFLILESEGRLTIAVHGSIDQECVTTLQSAPVDTCNQLSQAIVNYVARTREGVALDDAAREGAFTSDPYVLESQPKSILCIPLIHQAKLTGILYLENRLATGAFTADRLEMLELFCSQAAVSLENARLYERLQEYSQTLEQKVASRTRELQESEAKYRTIFETTGTATVIVEKDTKISLSNSEFQKLTGHSRDEIDGRKHLTEFVPPQNTALITQAQDMLTSGDPLVIQGCEIGIIDKQGLRRDVISTISAIPGTAQSVASFVDISQRKKVESQLRFIHEAAAAEARKLRSLIEGMDEGIVLADADDTITEINSWFLRKVGMQRSQVVGKKVWDFHPTQDTQARVRKLILDFKTGLQQEAAVTNREFFGMHVSFRVHPIFDGARYSGVILYVVDVTDLEEARKHAEQASQAKGDFLANMSHELRTPLNAIIGFSEILEDKLYGGLNEKQSIYVRHVLTSGRHLLQLINDILDLTKVESGKVELEVSSIDIKKVLESILVMIRPTALGRSLSLHLSIAEDLQDVEIQADEMKLKQILFNLLANAVKFTPEGGAIGVEARKMGHELAVSVSDTGVGIKPEDRDRIFRMFEQVDSSLGRRQQGTGLGLALARKMVELHGGRIEVESAGEHRGSRFTFVIPLRQTEDGDG